MEVVRRAVAGTMESSDVYLEVTPYPQGVEIELNSTVMRQFGDSIKATLEDVLTSMQVENVRVKVDDRGALECVLRARLETALLRAAKEVQ